jgi:hypothetical protein
VSVSASVQKETYKQKPVFEAAVLSIAPESSTTCVSSASAQKGTHKQKPGFEAVVEIEPAVEGISRSTPL